MSDTPQPTLELVTPAGLVRAWCEPALPQLQAQLHFIASACPELPPARLARCIARALRLPASPHAKGALPSAVTVAIQPPGAHREQRVTLGPEPSEFTLELKSWGTVQVIYEDQLLGLYRLNLAPGGAIPDHLHRHMNETEFALHAGLMLRLPPEGAQPLRPGTINRWALHQPHGYQNPTDRWASLLCIDQPRFDPSDEVELELEEAP